ncbi:Beta-fructofuranosidase, insoluble isoenzyme 1 [Camellia lanceoleosa]|uniref:Beta-fructofuranosidase, insoluble isoenzyme 1 n=1 Tax=Camellia lanceoleosa TaxID=1840588 RepID=A0ACC0HMG5_9ERIC|nr:Beta-fructofuranosidase, insoluble isoenzyme 1 [Camellia lanceoleosa]
MAHLYRSKDFMKWTKAQYPLHSSAMTGMWECPDFYSVSLDSENGLEVSVIEGNIKHVLKTIPRKVWLDKSEKQLVQWPVEELETLRRRKVHLSNQKLNLGDHVEIKEITAAQKKLYKPLFAGFVNVDLAQNILSLRSLIDNSVVESFGAGGKTCITSRVYPTLAVFKDAHLYVFNNGTETVTVDNLDAWSMNNPLMN